MPNWCQTTVFITSSEKGKNENVEKLHKIIEELENHKKPINPNGFGVCWLGELVTALGEDWHKVSCRGEWYYMDFSDNMLELGIDSAWEPPYEVFDLIKEKFPDLQIKYRAIEEGNQIFETNDREFFPDKYVMDYNILFKDGYHSDTAFFETEKEVIDFINEELELPVKTLVEAENYKFEDDDNYISINEIELV